MLPSPAHTNPFNIWVVEQDTRLIVMYGGEEQFYFSRDENGEVRYFDNSPVADQAIVTFVRSELQKLDKIN